MKFNSKKEFALAIIEHGKLYNQDGEITSFDPERTNPFRLSGVGFAGGEMYEVWDKFNEEWYTTPPLNDKQPVMAWFESKFIKVYGFYDAVNECLYDSSGERDGHSYDNIVAIPDHEVPQWMKEAQKTLED